MHAGDVETAPPIVTITSFVLMLPADPVDRLLFSINKDFEQSILPNQFILFMSIFSSLFYGSVSIFLYKLFIIFRERKSK